MKKFTVKDQNTSLPLVRISVRNLVEFLLRNGDINTAMPSGRDAEAMLEGGKIHRKIQKIEETRTQGKYQPEVSLQFDTRFEEMILRIEGRADGILEEEEDSGKKFTVDEIKGMYFDVRKLEEPFLLHLAQAKCYAFMYAQKEHLSEISVQMTYVNLESEEIQRFLYTFPFPDLEEWFGNLAAEYHKWARWLLLHQKKRNASMKSLEFPFPYREGQKKLTAAVYHTIKEGKELFLMAPTGVGKTMSCVFPAVRAIGEGYGDRIFYLTAKNETLSAGAEAIRILKEHGLVFQSVQLTAKEKICLMQEVSCTPEDCPYAKGHFDRVNDALYDLLTNKESSDFQRDIIVQQAEQYQVCPYELTRDLADWSDGILCDYNYVFDPKARLGKYFGEGASSDAVFLVDEAHNLVDRGRDMYSASFCKEHVLSAKRDIPGIWKKQRNALAKVNALMLELKHNFPEHEQYQLISSQKLEKLFYACLQAYGTLQELFQAPDAGEVKQNILDFYFELGDFCSVFQILDQNYQIYLESADMKTFQKEEKAKPEFSVRLFCVNPAALLTECVDKGRCAVFFSATLLPISYFKNLLTVKKDCYAIYAESPFPKNHRKILIGRDVSTRYRQRGYGMYKRIAFYISAMAKSKAGNYFAFFPSYRMMRDVFDIYKEEFDCPEINYVMQSPFMAETDREIFLENFYENTEQSLIAFAIMGGMFSEGIDLRGTRLIGAAIVGAGLPQVSAERDILRQYYDSHGKNGFDYAYRYPGMNKAEQAAGRVIRTESDRGVILLLDERFLGREYRELFPREWSDIEICDMQSVEARIRKFWETDSFCGRENDDGTDKNRNI